MHTSKLTLVLLPQRPTALVSSCSLEIKHNIASSEQNRLSDYLLNAWSLKFYYFRPFLKYAYLFFGIMSDFSDINIWIEKVNFCYFYFNGKMSEWQVNLIFQKYL